MRGEGVKFRFFEAEPGAGRPMTHIKILIRKKKKIFAAIIEIILPLPANLKEVQRSTDCEL